jgi:hypothetical protein
VTTKFAIRLPEKLAEKLPKKPPKLLVLGATFLIGGGAITYLNFAQRAPRSLSPTGTQLVPQTALATMTVTTDELTWTKLRQFGTADTQPQLDGLLSEWKNRLSSSGYSYKRDIKPWIGDRVTLAVLGNPSSEDQPGTSEGLAATVQNLVLVVPIADPLKAKSILEEKASETDTLQKTRKYRGVDVLTRQTKDGTIFESAVIGTSWLLLSNSASGIEQAIDTQKGDRSLLDVAGYRKAATRIESPQPPGKNFAQLYLNIPAASQALAPSSSDPNVQQGSILPLQGSQGLVSTVLIEPEGLRFQGTSWLSPQNDLAYSDLRNEAGEMPRRLPSETLMMMSGSNLQQFWRGFSESNSSPPFFPNPQNLEAGLLTQTGLDLEEDILPWAAGEFTLGILPPPKAAAEAGAAVGSAPLLLMVQTSDRKTAESVWAQLDDVMVSRYRFKVETREFEGGSLTQWVSPFQGLQFSHGWLPGNITFFAVGEGAAEAIPLEGFAIAPATNRPLAARKSLAETRLFQTLTDEAPKPNNGHFFIDLAQINALQGVFPLPQLSPEGPTAAIQAVGLTATVDGRAMDYDLYVKLTKGAQPGAL